MGFADLQGKGSAKESRLLSRSLSRLLQPLDPQIRHSLISTAFTTSFRNMFLICFNHKTEILCLRAHRPAAD